MQALTKIKTSFYWVYWKWTIFQVDYREALREVRNIIKSNFFFK